jgi:hypothetical protein
MSPRILIAFERSGVMRRAFRDIGYEAWSCDIVRADDGSNHHICDDIHNVLRDGWDAAIALAHPVCTVLCNSGVRWLYNADGSRNKQRWEALHDAAALYRLVRDSNISHVATENPVMHRHAIALTQRGPTQFVQPWWFGDPYFKATGFELKNLPKLKPTNRLTPPKAGSDEHKKWSMVHRQSPGPDRARTRSQTFPGIAAACAEQWGCVIERFVSSAGYRAQQTYTHQCEAKKAGAL